MRLTIRMAGLAAAMLLAQAATAAPVDYDCDTPIGDFSQLIQTQAGPAYHVQGTIKPLQWRDDPDQRWAPLGQVRLMNADGSRSIAVRVARNPGAARGVVSVMLWNGGPPQSTAMGDVGLNEALPFELRALPSGDVVIIVRGQQQVFHLDLGRSGKVEATCSTGEFLFGGLDLGG